jgi:hypothetical protein
VKYSVWWIVLAVAVFALGTMLLIGTISDDEPTNIEPQPTTGTVSPSQ